MIDYNETGDISFVRKDEKRPILLRGDRNNRGKVPFFYYPLLEESGMVCHGFTTRLGGVSKDHLESLNLGFFRGDLEDNVRENFQRLADTMQVSKDSFCLSVQTHTTNVIRVHKEDAGNGIVTKNRYQDVDGMVTNETGVTLVTFYADCVPLFFVDPVKKAIGLSHSGWRGTVGRMGKATIEKMQQEFGSNPNDILCAIGPSICQDCYEIGTEVAVEFEREFAQNTNEILQRKENGKYQLNLWRANELVLEEAGIQKNHLAVTNVCTCCNDKLLFSHRATKGKRGNLAAVLALRDASI